MSLTSNHFPFLCKTDLQKIPEKWITLEKTRSFEVCRWKDYAAKKGDWLVISGVTDFSPIK